MSRGQNGHYYVVATDLDASLGWLNSKLMIWDIADITKAEEIEPTIIDINDFVDDMEFFKTTDDTTVELSHADYDFQIIRAWAPEVIWDSSANAYMMYWTCNASATSDSSSFETDIKFYYSYTKDFVNFTTPQVLSYNTHWDAIDADIIAVDKDGETVYYMFYREPSSEYTDSSGNVTTTSTISYCASTTLNSFDATNKKSLDAYIINSDGLPKGVEGPEAYQASDGRYIVTCDAYGENSRYYAYSIDLTADDPSATVENVTDETNFADISLRHIGMTSITTSEYNSLLSTYNSIYYTSSSISSYLKARLFTNSDDITYDAVSQTSGYLTTSSRAFGFSGTRSCQPAAYFKSTVKRYAYISSGSLTSLSLSSGVTFSWYGKTSDSSVSRFFDFSTNTSISSLSLSDNYIYVSSNGVIAYCINGAETTRWQYAENNDTWKLYTIVLEQGKLSYYVDGTLVVTFVDDDITTSWFNKLTKNGTLMFGKSSYSSDAYLNGYITDFRVYD